MLGRKQSLRQTVTASLAATAAGLMGTGTGTSAMVDSALGGSGGGGTGGSSAAVALGPGAAAAAAAAGLELEECIHARIMWWESAMVRRFMRFCAFLSLVSVSLNTSYTFNRMASLLYITFVIDLSVTFVFAIEFVSKVRIRGSRNYFHDRWAQFDAIMLLCLVMSLVLHVFEILGYVKNFSPLSMIRAPRPLIMVRLVRVFLSFSMPRARITQIFLRSSQQIYNVTLFFLFFMSLFGLLGVQFFSRLHHHCVLKDNYTLGTHEPTIHQLAIPDTYCSPTVTHGHQCPSSMICIEIYNSSGYAGFDNLAHALFTVYQSASQEGWSHVMYQAMDSLDMFRAAFYFVTLIFFLAWLVKNVFIAVITETFNEIRVQFQQMWGERAQISTETMPSILIGDDRWRLVQVTDTDTGTKAPYFIRKILSTASFQISVMLVIVLNAIVNASIKFDHSGRPREQYYLTIYPAEVFFTIIFDIEVILKIWCYGFRSYIRRSLHKLELLLAIGSTAHILPPLYMTPPLVYFQVLRIVRLIKASPVLEDFVYKIFGPGKKLGSLIIFTMCLLIVTSSISMQLFCCFAGYNKFQSFPEAFMSMFQILTQEGWTEVMNETILRSGRKIGPLVAIYFILYHLFVSLIVLSLFVAVILDNLELDEDIKKVKQLKAREQSAGFNEELPLRLRLFESFPDSPQMTRLHKSANEFSIPKVRDSFMRCFIDSTNTIATTVPTGTTIATSTSVTTVPYVSNYNYSSNNSSSMMGGGAGAAAGRPMAYNGYLTASSKPMPSSLTSSGVANTGSSFVALRKQAPIKLLSSISKGRHSSPLLRRVQVACIVSDSNNQRLLLGDGSGLPGTGVGGFTRGVGGVAGAAGGRSMRRSVRGTLKEEVGTEESQSTGTGPTVRGQDFDFKMLQRKRQQAEMRRTQRESDLRENHPFFDTPLLLVGRESRFRLICQSIVSAKYDPHVRDPITGKERKVRYKGTHELLGLVPYCDWLMIIVTTVSCASMMCETGEMRVSNTPALIIAEYTFVTAMALELTLKTMADGLLFTPNAYLANVAGVMDFSIFAVSVFFLFVLPEHVPPQSWQQTLLVLRCVRPLRIFSLVPHMRKVVYELCRGFKEIALVSVLLIVLLFVFASVGVHMFGGLLARCNDPCITKRKDCVGVFMRSVHVTRMKIEHQTEHMPAVLVPRVWANPRRFNFDALRNGILALFEVLSFKGWLDIRDVILARLTPLDAIYIHVFVFLGCMIGLTLFVGVVIANYGENKGTALLTVDQRRWCDLKKRLKIAQPLHLPPRPDHHQGRAIIYDITQHIAFKRFIALLVLANSSLLCVSWDTSMSHTVPLANVSATFTGVFVFEVMMKMIAFTPRGYWQSRRNRYDLFVTVLGVFWLVLHFTLMNQTSNAFGFIVVILRFFTITGKHATLKMLMLTVAVSVYKSFFIIMGLFLLILCYALAGVILFGSVKFGENISRHANFRTAPLGVITLFRIVTGEDWNKIMHDAMLSPPFCTPGFDFWSTDCGNYYASLTFFCSFYVCITYIVLNLLVAIIMENFSLFYSNEEDALLSYADIRNFQNTWNLVDLLQRGMIPISRVKFVLRLLKGRLEVDPNKDRLLFKHMCHEMERLHNGEDVTFHDVLNMLSYRSVDIRKSLQLEELLAREELEFLIEEEVAKATIRAWLDKCLRRIKKERQHQSLMHSLRATNEQPVSIFLSGLSGGIGGGGMGDYGDSFMGFGQSSVGGGLLQQSPQFGGPEQMRDEFGQLIQVGKDGTALDGKPVGDSSGDDSATKTIASRFKAAKETHHKPPEHHHHIHKRVEFRHVEERSKKSTEDNLTGNQGIPGTGTNSLNDDAGSGIISTAGTSSTGALPQTSSLSASSSSNSGSVNRGNRKGLTKQQQLTLTIPEEEERIKEPKMSNVWSETDLGVLGGSGPSTRKLTPIHTPTTETAPRLGDNIEEPPTKHLHHHKKRTTFQQSPTPSTHDISSSGLKSPQTDPGTVDDGSTNGSSSVGRRFLSLHSYPPTSAVSFEAGTSSSNGISGLSTAVITATTNTTTISFSSSTTTTTTTTNSNSTGAAASRSSMIKHLSKEPTAHLSKSSLRTMTKYPSADEPSTEDNIVEHLSTLPTLPSTSASTSRLQIHRQNSDGVIAGVNFVGSISSGALHQKRMSSREASESLDSSASLPLPLPIENTIDGTSGGVGSGGAPGTGNSTTTASGSAIASTTATGKKFNLIRAQIMVNEVHDWWMLHLS